MKQNLSFLILASSCLAISYSLEVKQLAAIEYGGSTHKHSSGRIGFLSSKQTEADPPTPPAQEEDKQFRQQALQMQLNSNGVQRGSGWGVFLGVVICILLIAGILYAYYQYQEYIIKTEGAMKTELGIKKQALNSNQLMLLNLLTFNSKHDDLTNVFYTDDVIIKQKKEEANRVVLGEYLQAEFTQQGEERMIVCNYPVSFTMDNSYYEIELEQIKQTNCDYKLAIGFIPKSKIDQFKKSPTIGQYENLFDQPNSVIFSSKGNVKIGLSKEVELETEPISYGETIGIGYSKKDSRIWLTQNGEFLNPPPLEEIKQLMQATKKQEPNKDEEESNAKKEEQKPEEIEEERKRKERVLKLILAKGKNESEAIYPFVLTNFACVIDINVGGYPFRFSQKEIATGLLV